MRDRLAALLFFVACHPTETVVTEAPVWEVYDGEECILTVRGEPGPITSTAPPPPGGVVTTHPFLSGAAHDAGYEDELRRILEASSSVADFLSRLEGAGYRVEAVR